MLFPIGVLGFFVVVLMLGSGATQVIGDEQFDRIPSDPRIGKTPEGAVTERQEDVIRQFSSLKPMSAEGISELSKDTQQRLRYALKIGTNQGPGQGISSFGQVETPSGSDVILFTTGDLICVFSRRKNGANHGVCNDLDLAPSGRIYSVGMDGKGPNWS